MPKCTCKYRYVPYYVAGHYTRTSYRSGREHLLVMSPLSLSGISAESAVFVEVPSLFPVFPLLTDKSTDNSY